MPNATSAFDAAFAACEAFDDYRCLDHPGATPADEDEAQGTARRSATILAVPVRHSVTPGFLVCLEDGLRFKSLTRHLRTRYGLSPDQYRDRWGLPRDYPMVAPNIAIDLDRLARSLGVDG